MLLSVYTKSKENKMKKTQVMVVEDEALVGIDIQRNLVEYGYNVTGVSSSGEDAIDVARKIRPEIVLMDIRLKGEMNGIETAKYFRKTLGIPTIYLTAYSDDKTLKAALQANPYGYLLKPFVPKELHTTIQTALYRSEDEKKVKLETKLERLRYIQHNISKKANLQAMIVELQLDSSKKEHKKIERLRYISNNILKRKEFEQKFKKQNNFLEKMKVLLDNFWYIQNVEDNPKGVFPLEEFANILGYSDEEIERMGNLSNPVLIDPDDYHRITEYFQKTVLTDGEINEIEFRLKHRNGTWKWFSNRCTFLGEEPGSRKTINIVREITKVKNMEESLLMEEEKLSAIGSNPYLGVAILDVDGKILDINPTLERLSGYTKAELSPLNYSEFMSLRGIITIREQFQKMKLGFLESFQIETIIYPKHREAFWGYIVFSTIHNMDGIRDCIACSLIDISDTKLFEKMRGNSQTVAKVH